MLRDVISGKELQNGYRSIWMEEKELLNYILDVADDCVSAVCLLAPCEWDGKQGLCRRANTAENTQPRDYRNGCGEELCDFCALETL